MTFRWFVHVTAVVALLVPALSLRAQDAANNDVAVENAKYQIAGTVNANAVFVRSGNSDNDYPTMQLNKGAEVTVVGERFSWLKIVPPEGSFCYVAKAFVNRTGTGDIGVVTGNAINVRAGSSLNLLTTKVVSKLEPNQRVEILGDYAEYYKIKPPADVFYYVNKQFVDPARQINAQAPTSGPMQQASGPQTAWNNAGQAVAPTDSRTDTPTTAPTVEQPAIAEAPATAPATQSAADAQTQFEQLETQYLQTSQRPLDEQPIKEMLDGYKKLASSDSLPESMRRIAEFKASTLQSRAKMQEEYMGHKQYAEDMKSKQVALQAEAGELKDRITKAEVEFYTAIGTLRTSSLQYGQSTLYRLTDPANGRTVVYIRTDDPKMAQHLGEFIGVHGEVATDTQRNMTIITPTAFEAVNPGKFGQSVVAQYAPASLLPSVAGSATGGE